MMIYQCYEKYFNWKKDEVTDDKIIINKENGKNESFSIGKDGSIRRHYTLTFFADRFAMKKEITYEHRNRKRNQN